MHMHSCRLVRPQTAEWIQCCGRLYYIVACSFCLCRTNKALADSLNQAVDPEDSVVNRLLRMMATQAMSQALYFSTGARPQDQYYHYGKINTDPTELCLYQ